MDGHKTYREVCEQIVSVYNKETKGVKITWEDLWRHPAITEYPLMWLSMMSSAGDELLGLILTNSNVAKIFWEILEKKNEQVESLETNP